MSLDRARVWKLLGAPANQLGSVNEPRTHEEHGVKWNEKWVYLGEDGQPQRLVLWNRYDFVGAFRLAPDGSAEPLPLPED